MHVVFRVDASPSIGTGHVRRCLTLATKLREAGAEAEFVTQAGPGNLAGQIRESGFSVSEIPAPTSGSAWQEDSEATKRILTGNRERPQWLIVDHYQLDHRWESSLRDSVDRIMVIDDLANRRHDCELLLDQNLVAGLDSRYAGKVAQNCGLLLGPRYALLEAAYAELHESARVRSGPVRRMIISFGGVDADNVTRRTLSAFLQLKRGDIKVDVALGASSPHAKIVQALAAGHANIKVHLGLPTLARLLVTADLAVGATGTTTWERLCLGVPSIVITLAPNQETAAQELDRLGLVRLLGRSTEVSDETITSALGQLLENGLDPDWSSRCLATVDGHGSRRVAAAIAASAASPLVARLASAEDESLLLEWANDAETRANAFSPGRISADTHAGWFRARLGNASGCRLYIVEMDAGVPVGVVRFERADDAWEVHYSVAQPFRRRGIARPLLATALSELRSQDANARVFGQVKESNQASRRVFEALGFTELAAPREGVVAYGIELDSRQNPSAGSRGKAHANR